MDTAKTFHPEEFRYWLLILARTQLRDAGALRRKVEASDLVQDVLLQAHRGWPDFRGTSQAELEAWLRKILARKLTDAARRYGRKKRDAGLEESFRESLDRSSVRLNRLVPANHVTPSKEMLAGERARLIAEAMMELPEEQARAIEAHYLRDLSVADTAQSMDRTPASVAGLLRRGLQALRKRVSEGLLG